ncbi:MAG: GTP 3',8-cyclase MoaA [Verrucomicrobiae bacterium]|nr:GTP 3',8-cyclase MoaA [Verrucomicrobiae bacterium]
MLTDAHHHTVTYLRISVTDRCNERCLYCMPDEQQQWLPRSDILSYEEILRVVRVGVGLGITKYRVTGGEPLVRRDILRFISRLCATPGVADVGMTTNGTLLKNMARDLRDAGLENINISLDSLRPEGYAAISGRPLLAEVLQGIEAAREAGFRKIKLNMVLIRGKNDDEIMPMVEFARARGLALRFIEMMPVSSREVLTEENFISVGEVMQRISRHFALVPKGDYTGNGPAVYYTDPAQSVTLGFIGAMTNLHFCDSCNKMRLTCEGKLRPCLGAHDEYDLRALLRNSTDDALLKNEFLAVVARKPAQHAFRDNYQPGRKMIAIGG